MKPSEVKAIFEDLRKGKIDKLKIAQLEQFCLDERNQVSLPNSLKKYIKDNLEEIARVLKKPQSIVMANVNDGELFTTDLEILLAFFAERSQ